MSKMIFPITKREAEKQGIQHSSDANKNALFPSQLRNLRNEKGISQLELSKVLAVSKSTIGLWETGDTLPDAESLYKIARYFEVSADWLLGLSQTPSTDESVEAVCKATGIDTSLAEYFVNGKRNGVRLDSFLAVLYSPPGEDNLVEFPSVEVFNCLFTPETLHSLLAEVWLYYKIVKNVTETSNDLDELERQRKDGIDKEWLNGRLAASMLELGETHRDLRCARFDVIDTFTKLFDDFAQTDLLNKQIESIRDRLIKLEM